MIYHLYHHLEGDKHWRAGKNTGGETENPTPVPTPQIDNHAIAGLLLVVFVGVHFMANKMNFLNKIIKKF